MSAKPRYFLPDNGETASDATEIDCVWTSCDFIAEAAAEHYHAQRDGWEATWPKRFTVIVDGQESTYLVERYAVPAFRAVPA